MTSISNELTILIESCKVSLFGGASDKMIEVLETKQIDWQKLLKLAAFHRIRPVVYAAFRKCPPNLIDVATLSFLQDFSTQQMVTNMLNIKELASILQLLVAHGVRVLPYKGYTIMKAWYGNNPIREIGDIDILVHPEDAHKGLKVLLENGYDLELKSQPNETWTTDELIANILTIEGWHEVTLKTIEEDKVRFEIDFHWHLYEGFYNYAIDERKIFLSPVLANIATYEAYIPNNNDLLLMTILHHGGRESWVRLRSLCDLGMWLSHVYNDEKWPTNYQTVEKSRLKNLLLWGVYTVGELFGIDTPMEIRQHLPQKYTDRREQNLMRWSKGAYFDSKLLPKIHNTLLLVALQDDSFKFSHYLKKYLSSFSTPNLVEPPRLLTFPRRFTLLNLTSKIITYLWRKGF